MYTLYEYSLMATLAILTLELFANSMPQNLIIFMVFSVVVALAFVHVYYIVGVTFGTTFDAILDNLALICLVIASLEIFCHLIGDKIGISSIIHFMVLVVAFVVFEYSIAFGIFLGAIASSIVRFYFLDHIKDN